MPFFSLSILFHIFKKNWNRKNPLILNPDRRTASVQSENEMLLFLKKNVGFFPIKTPLWSNYLGSIRAQRRILADVDCIIFAYFGCAFGSQHVVALGLQIPRRKGNTDASFSFAESGEEKAEESLPFPYFLPFFFQTLNNLLNVTLPLFSKKNKFPFRSWGRWSISRKRSCLL